MSHVSLRTDRQARRLRSGIAAAVVAFGLIAVIALLWRGSANVTAAAPPSTTASALSFVRGRAPLVVERTIAARSLGLHGLVRVAIAPDGTAYATDSSQRVVHLTLDGKVLQTWGETGIGPGQFEPSIGAIAVGADGKVYVADVGNTRVQVFSPTGRFLGAHGVFGYEPWKFILIGDIAVDAAGGLYVVDDEGISLTKLAPNGQQLWRIGPALGGTGPHLAGHVFITGFDDRGRLLAVNDEIGFVVRVDGSGREVSAVGPLSAAPPPSASSTSSSVPGGVCDATVDGDGLMYVTSCDHTPTPHLTLAVVDVSGRVLARWPNCPLTRAPAQGPGGVMVGVTNAGDLAVLRRNF